MSKKYAIVNLWTYCDNNNHLENRIRSYLRQNSIAVATNNLNEADIIFFLSCVCWTRTEEDAINKYTRAQHDFRGKQLIACGCIPTLNVKDFPDFTFIRSRDLGKLDELFNPSIPMDKMEHDPDLVRDYANPLYSSALVLNISVGCVHNCSYCSIKQTKGMVKSVSKDKLKIDLEKGIRDGYQKVVLMADDCGSYGLDIGTDFALLLNELYDTSKGKIIFLIHYWYPSSFVELFAKVTPSVFKKIEFLCVPLQSFSNRSLRLMNRNYKVKEVMTAITHLKTINPNIFLRTQFIYGFPQESYRDFFRTLELHDTFQAISYFFFSAKKGTLAYEFKDKVSLTEVMNKSMILGKESLRHPSIQTASIQIKMDQVFREYSQLTNRVLGINLKNPLAENVFPFELLQCIQPYISDQVGAEILDINVDSSLSAAIILALGSKDINTIIIASEKSDLEQLNQIKSIISKSGYNGRVLLSNSRRLKWRRLLFNVVTWNIPKIVPYFLLASKLPKYQALLVKKASFQAIEQYILERI